MPIAQEVSDFFTQKTKPHYLSHAVRALSDHIHEELKDFLIANQKTNLPGRELYHHRILRLFEIKLLPIDKLDSPARVRIICLNKNEKDLYGCFLAKIEYDPQAFDMKEDKDAEKKLRFLIAHELGHIFLYKERFLEILKGDMKISSRKDIFNSQILPPDHDEEIKAWQFALALIHHKDQFYHQAPNKFCYCCEDKIFHVCLHELIDHPGAKNKLQRCYYNLKNDKRIISCENCSG